ncbi:hypothetical protein HYPSUDRAFT_204683 [Hypholoma sublateritium FD-334 SS-4]|uniref:Uncharacterized protein n=1 Tax=Hypholoma sublateritium (strain FD-334 SS-4) TaxID=945553 RepID=A0A0D2NRF3_HYPSF|nr:hypothetical protein HYPSUDRAFT_204683 [Hypholoma sublateritium FD-334 SS-4]
MIKSTAHQLVPQLAPQSPAPVPTSNWHPQPHPQPLFPPQIQYVARPSLPVKVEETAVHSLDVKPPVIEPVKPQVKPQADHFANLLSTLFKAGVVSATATPTGAGAISKEAAMSVDIPKSSDSSDAVIREYMSLRYHVVWVGL